MSGPRLPGGTEDKTDAMLAATSDLGSGLLSRVDTVVLPDRGLRRPRHATCPYNSLSRSVFRHMHMASPRIRPGHGQLARPWVHACFPLVWLSRPPPGCTSGIGLYIGLRTGNTLICLRKRRPVSQASSVCTCLACLTQAPVCIARAESDVRAYRRRRAKHGQSVRYHSSGRRCYLAAPTTTRPSIPTFLAFFAFLRLPVPSSPSSSTTVGST